MSACTISAVSHTQILNRPPVVMSICLVLQENWCSRYRAGSVWEAKRLLSANNLTFFPPVSLFLSLSTTSLSFLLQTAGSKPLQWLSTKVNSKEKPTWTTGRPAPESPLTRSHSQLLLTSSSVYWPHDLWSCCIHLASKQTQAWKKFHLSSQLPLKIFNYNHAGVLKINFCTRVNNNLLICTAKTSDSTFPFVSPKYNWWMGAIGVRAGWRCSTTARGERCVTTTGTWWMPTWCVSSWTAAWLWRWAAALTLDKGRGSSSWTTWTAKGTRASWASATASAGLSTTATTMRMWGSPAKVAQLLSPLP